MVEERVHPVPDGVLHRELPLDEADRVGIRADARREAAQAFEQLRLRGLQRGIRVERRGVDDRARRQHEHHRLERAVGVLDRPARHAAGVVGDHPADRARRLAGGVGAQSISVPEQTGVDLPDGGTRLHPHAAASVEHVDPPEGAPRVHEDVLAGRLPRQARPARAERDPGPARGGGAHDRPDLGGVVGDHHGARCVQEVRGVARVRDPVDRPQPDALRLADRSGDGGVDPSLPRDVVVGVREGMPGCSGHGVGTIQPRIGVDCR